MAVQVQHRRGSTDDHSTFTGAVGEITVDTTKKTAVVHDGSTAGGVPLAKEADVTAAADNVVLTGYEIADTAALPASTDTINAAIGKLAKTASDNTTQLADVAKSKLSFVNVKALGAKGDGVTDDTAIIQAAFDIYPNVYIPEGNYKLLS